MVPGKRRPLPMPPAIYQCRAMPVKTMERTMLSCPLPNAGMSRYPAAAFPTTLAEQISEIEFCAGNRTVSEKKQEYPLCSCFYTRESVEKNLKRGKLLLSTQTHLKEDFINEKYARLRHDD